MNDSGPINRFSPALSPYAAAFADGESVGSQTPSPFGANVSPSQMTLADIRRKNLDEQQAEKDESHLRRFRMLNFSSDNSILQKVERKLQPFYCSVCAAHALVTEANLDELPKRSTDSSICLLTSEFFHKIYAVPAERTIIRRSHGLEMQQRLKCKDCGAVMAYHSDNEKPAKILYIFPDALVKDQTCAESLKVC